MAQARKPGAEVDIAPPCQAGQVGLFPSAFPVTVDLSVSVGVGPETLGQGQGEEMMGKWVYSARAMHSRDISWADVIACWIELQCLGNPVSGSHRAFHLNLSE